MILTDQSSNSQLPRWSPDGQHIAFLSDRGGYWAVHVMSADGSEPQQVSRDTLGLSDLVWSPDGQRIAFLVDVTRSPKLYVVGADGQGEQRLFSDLFSYWSPQWWQL
jgi:TolB protein